jgi:hypothetical protein
MNWIRFNMLPKAFVVLATALASPLIVYGGYEAISHAYTVANLVNDPPTFGATTSASYTVTNLCSDPPLFMQATSRSMTVTHRDPTIAGDFDSDGFVTIYDYQHFFGCFAGLNGGIRPECNTADMHRDGDVDLQDAAAFCSVFTGW